MHYSSTSSTLLFFCESSLLVPLPLFNAIRLPRRFGEEVGPQGSLARDSPVITNHPVIVALRPASPATLYALLYRLHSTEYIVASEH
jgi:hypothetical protein